MKAEEMKSCNKAVVEETVDMEYLFTGKAAHAGGAPEQGINAVSAGVNFLNGLNGMRQQFFKGMLFNAVMREGGIMMGTIPDRCVIDISLQADTHEDLAKMLTWFENFAHGSAMMNGCGCEITTLESAAK